MPPLDPEVPPAASPVDRRAFLRQSCGLAAAFALASCGVPLAGCSMTNVTAQTPGVSVTGSTLTLDLTLVTALQPEGGSLWVSDADAIVVHAPGDDFRAFSAICAHEGNPVRVFEPWGAGYRLRCPTHGWTYDLDGQPTGEARRGIPRLALTRENDLLRVTLA